MAKSSIPGRTVIGLIYSAKSMSASMNRLCTCRGAESFSNQSLQQEALYYN